ncbi:MAG TPA: peptidase T [Ignavibacteria bacterium]|nr:peptidase T [Ignavibacteria bacterium]HQY50902.1 peptidase T [Ignavibacteria bacterium]HRA98893.1 peptidase T [Ignavibacteria bacterium]
MNIMDINYTCTDRFLKYVKIDTQSSHDSDSFPSTKKQKDLGIILVEELKQMGISDAEIDKYGYVYATIPSNSDKNVPVICFCSHMDTSPDASGKNVNPVIHRNYQGGDIILPKDKSKVILANEHPQLASQIGNDIITSDGTTLLGADDKAGIAEIMDAANYLMTHPDVKHGKIRILFTPDEEVGHGVDHVDIKKLGADFGYTMDGSDLGSVEDETFSGDTVHLYIKGFNIHPGFSKDRMENAIKIANKIISRLPPDSLSPETTEGKEGFIHPVNIKAEVDSAYIKFIVRDFDNAKLKEKEDLIQKIAEEVIKDYKKASFEIRIEESYRNMKEVLDKNPEIMDYAVEAVNRTGVKAFRNSIRGGTDGCRLSFMGLPCPNIFAGGHAFHSNLEWISVQDMEKALETIIHLCMIWEEKA